MEKVSKSCSRKSSDCSHDRATIFSSECEVGKSKSKILRSNIIAKNLKKFFLSDEVLRNQILMNLELDKIIEKIDQL